MDSVVLYMSFKLYYYINYKNNIILFLLFIIIVVSILLFMISAEGVSLETCLIFARTSFRIYPGLRKNVSVTVESHRPGWRAPSANFYRFFFLTQESKVQLDYIRYVNTGCKFSK